MTRYVIPLTGEPESFTVTLGGIEYRMTLRWCDTGEGGWLLDVALADGTALVAAIPLVTGVDLLAAHGHIGFAGMLWCQSPSETVPGPGDLGTEVQLIFETEEDA